MSDFCLLLFKIPLYALTPYGEMVGTSQKVCLRLTMTICNVCKLEREDLLEVFQYQGTDPQSSCPTTLLFCFLRNVPCDSSTDLVIIMSLASLNASCSPQ